MISKFPVLCFCVYGLLPAGLAGDDLGQTDRSDRLYCEIASIIPSLKDSKLRPRIHAQSDENGVFVLALIEFNEAFTEALAIVKGIPSITQVNIRCLQRMHFGSGDAEALETVNRIDKLRFFFQDSSSTVDWVQFQAILEKAGKVEMASVNVPAAMLKSFLGSELDKAEVVRFDLLKPDPENQITEVRAIVEQANQRRGLKYDLKLEHRDEDRISFRFIKVKD
jgi:hypothetical protein